MRTYPLHSKRGAVSGALRLPEPASRPREIRPLSRSRITKPSALAVSAQANTGRFSGNRNTASSATIPAAYITDDLAPKPLSPIFNARAIHPAQKAEQPYRE